MTRHYAIEITLTRPASCRELSRARKRAPLAENADRTRLMTMQNAKSPSRALHIMRRRIGGQLPVDVLATHYPDHSGQVLLNVDLGRAAARDIRRAAVVHNQRPGDFLRRRLAQAVARDERERHRNLTAYLEGLLQQHTREEVLSCAASLLTRRHRPSAP